MVEAGHRGHGRGEFDRRLDFPKLFDAGDRAEDGRLR